MPRTRRYHGASLCHRSSFALVYPLLAATIGLLSGACSSTGTPQISQTSNTCGAARSAIESLQQEGLTEGTFQRVETFLAEARALPTDDVYLLYLASYVGDAHRGPNPQLTLEPLLADVVEACSSTGF